MKQSPGDTNLTIHELKQGISIGDCNGIIKRMSAYAANINGSDSYWSNRRSELEATFEQKAPDTVFFTFSYADNHWEDLHRLMRRHFNVSLKNLETPTTQETVKNSKYQDVINNPHLVDWYFGYRLNKFLEIVFDGILECEWRWHRFEWQSRTAIHAHGAARFKNDPELIDLTANVYKSRLALKNSIGKVFNDQNDIEIFNKIIENDIIAEDKVTKFTDTLLTAFNNSLNFVQAVVPEPHPCSLRTSLIQNEDIDDDYNDLINCCQRHVCRVNGNCKSKNAKKACRYDYPFDVSEKTRIEFEESINSVKAKLILKRNDPYMNLHNRIICHNWRGNVDMQLILDQNAATNYMVKYATKSEKNGNSLAEMFKDVIGPAKENNNCHSKLRSIMIKSIAGKRD